MPRLPGWAVVLIAVFAASAILTALLWPAYAQLVPSMVGRTIQIEDRIVCEQAEEVPAFFHLATEMDGLGILHALIAARREGITCMIARGKATYYGRHPPFQFVTPHGLLTVTVHEFKTPAGLLYGWTTDQSGEGA